MQYNIDDIETLIANKLSEAITQFEEKEIKLIDIGVFPWHQSIEISLLFSDEIADVEDIASWEHYDFSKMSEGHWNEALTLADEMYHIWEKDCNIPPVLNDFATAVNSEKVIRVLKQLKLSDDFSIQILNPDKPSEGNYIKELAL